MFCLVYKTPLLDFKGLSISTELDGCVWKDSWNARCLFYRNGSGINQQCICHIFIRFCIKRHKVFSQVRWIFQVVFKICGHQINLDIQCFMKQDLFWLNVLWIYVLSLFSDITSVVVLSSVIKEIHSCIVERC